MEVLAWSGRRTTGMLVALALAALSGCGEQALSVPDDDAWVRAVDSETGISVELPGTTEMQTQGVPLATGGEVAARLWLVELGDYGAAGMVVAPAEGGPSDLPGVLAGAAAGVDGRVLMQSPASQNGLNALDGTVEFVRNGTARTVYLRIVDTRSSTVMLQSTARAADGEALAQLHQRLLDSVVVPQ